VPLAPFQPTHRVRNRHLLTPTHSTHIKTRERMIMSIPSLRPAVLSALIAAALGCALAPGQTYAAGAAGMQDGSRASQASERARELRERRGGGDDSDSRRGKNKPADARFPNATRESPDGKAGSKGARLLNKMQKDVEAEKWQDVLTAAEGIPDDFNAYEKGFGYLFAANAASRLDRMDQAETYFAKAVESDGLANDDHYQAMLNLAVVQNQREKAQEAYATIDRFVKETRTEDRDHLNFRAAMLIELDRTAEAAAEYDALLGKFPEDKQIFSNAVALQYQLGNNERVMALLKHARERNMLTEAAEYRNMYRPLIQEGKLTEALELIDEAVTKGIVKPDENLATDYQTVAESAYFDKSDVDMAIRYYQRAEELSPKGEISLNLATLLYNDGRLAEAKKAAQRALDKGVPAAKTDDARRILNAK